MFGPPGHLYVYKSYGIHWCANVVCEAEGIGAAVLLRALEPTSRIEEMYRRRRIDDPLALCAGPGRLTQALGVTGEHDGHRLDQAPFCLLQRSGSVDLVSGARVGISSATELPWRYALRASPYVSRPRPPG